MISLASVARSPPPGSPRPDLDVWHHRRRTQVGAADDTWQRRTPPILWLDHRPPVPRAQRTFQCMADLQDQVIFEWPAADLQRQRQAGLAVAVADRQCRAAGHIEGAVEERLEARGHRVLADGPRRG